MTDERTAIEALSRCRFLPGSFAKRFARDMAAMPENTRLTPKQRATVWKMVRTYRRQIPKWIVAAAEAWLNRPEEIIAFEQALDTAPDDWTTRLVYADWLEEHGDNDLASAQRWMAERELAPKLEPAGGNWGPAGFNPANYEWHWWPEAWMNFGDIPEANSFLAAWHPSREKAERGLAKAIVGKAAMLEVARNA